MSTNEVVFLDDTHKACTIGGVRYIKSWRKPSLGPRPKKDRREYMKAYRINKRDEVAKLRIALAEASATTDDDVSMVRAQ